MWSVSGQAVPGEVFAPGSSGFAVPETHFAQGATYSGVWRFLGQEVVVNSTPSVCTDTALPGACDPLDTAILTMPREHTRKLIMSLVGKSLAAAKAGKWKASNGKYAVPFMSRGSKALAVMTSVMPIRSGQYFKCQVISSSCVRKSVPKARLRKAFASIFAGTPPRGLQHLYKQSKSEIRKFDKVLARVPNSYAWCDR